MQKKKKKKKNNQLTCFLYVDFNLLFISGLNFYHSYSKSYILLQLLVILIGNIIYPNKCDNFNKNREAIRDGSQTFMVASYEA